MILRSFLLSLSFLALATTVWAREARSIDALREQVLAASSSDAIQWRRATPPPRVDNPRNPYDFVGIAHNEILHRGSTRKIAARPAGEWLEAWKDEARRFAGAVAPGSAPLVAEVLGRLCDPDPPRPWPCLPQGNGPFNPIDYDIMLRSAGPGGAPNSLWQGEVELLYGSVHRGEVAFAAEIGREVESALEQLARGGLESFVSRVVELEDRVLSSTLLEDVEKAPLLATLAIARHSAAFHTGQLAIAAAEKTTVNDVVQEDIGGALAGGRLGFQVGGVWGLAVGAALAGAVMSALEFSDYVNESAISLGGGDEGIWTSWLNRDGPSGRGDYEALSAFVESGQVCTRPLAVECRRRDGVDHRQTGQTYTCSLPQGGVCVNEGQRCADYEVRFLCP